MSRSILLATTISLIISSACAGIFGKEKKDDGKLFGISKPKLKNPLKKEKSLMEKMCFPGNARVIIITADNGSNNDKKHNNNNDAENGEAELEIPIHALRVGMKVKTGHNSYSPVFMFSHAKSYGTYPFIVLNNLTLSAGHITYTVEKGLVPARNVEIGDHLITTTGHGSVLERVTSKHETRENGLYNPHTLDGTLVVNGYLTSTYTEAIPESVANSLLTPFRMFFSVFGKDFSFGKLEQNSKLRSTIVKAFT